MLLGNHIQGIENPDSYGQVEGRAVFGNGSRRNVDGNLNRRQINTTVLHTDLDTLFSFSNFTGKFADHIEAGQALAHIDFYIGLITPDAVEASGMND